ncbi:hypothetical protein HD554DRAFT_2077597, partial [Boletus coccyginus]
MVELLLILFHAVTTQLCRGSLEGITLVNRHGSTYISRPPPPPSSGSSSAFYGRGERKQHERRSGEKRRRNVDGRGEYEMGYGPYGRDERG